MSEQKPKQDKPKQQQKDKNNNNNNTTAKKKPAASVKMESRNPEFWKHRIEIWDKFKKENPPQPPKTEPIKVTLPSGQTLDAIGGQTTGLEIAAKISKGLADSACAIKVNGVVTDLNDPLPLHDVVVQILKFEDPEGQKVFWHSSAHILGQALESLFEGRLCTGPPLDGKVAGFFYDAYMGDETIKDEFHPSIQSEVDRIIKEKQPFEKMTVPKAVALEMFKYNPYKSYILKTKVPDDGSCSVYRCGNLIDPCRGPHLPNTGRVKAYSIVKASSAYWLGKDTNDVVQRVYGISHPTSKQLAEWKHFQEEAAKRDHRKIGVAQELFFFDTVSSGSPFWLPHGTRIFQKLLDLMKNQYRKRGYEEVMSPNIYNSSLWETSGHWKFYKEDMFTFQVEKSDWALKPMNCPGHCMMFKHRVRSYRELPIRFADFGILHRNELSGALTGLTRVRRFVQDDAHIFARPDQIKMEIKNFLEFMQEIYGIFGFKFSLELSTRHEEKFMGSIEEWTNAETQMTEILNEFGVPWKINPGDGAFYGPKIDIHIEDALRRSHQCATVQLDFQLPKNFELEYIPTPQERENAAPDAKFRPVIIHRAIYGSFERFFAILIEHVAGKWPFWISPRQVILLTVMPDNEQSKFAQELAHQLRLEGFYVDVDDSGDLLKKKIREAQVHQYNYIVTIGPSEVQNKFLNVRTRDDNKQHPEVPIPKFIEMMKDDIKNFK